MKGCAPFEKAAATGSEKFLIGALLKEPVATLAASDAAGISTASFTDELAQAAFRAIVERLADSAAVDLVSVSCGMGRDEVDSMSFLAECMDLVSSAAFAPEHAGRIAEAHQRRTLALAIRGAQEALARGDSVANVAGKVKAAAEGIQDNGQPDGPVAAGDFMSEALAEPPQVIQGILRAEQVGILAAQSKSGKSWALLAVALAVCGGASWLRWKTTPGRVLYINGELPKYDLQRRLDRLASAMGLEKVPAGLDVWHLRGKRRLVAELIPAILRQQRRLGVSYSLVVPDPIYCFNGGRDENDNTAQAETMAELSELAELSGAAVLVAHHFSKGNKAQVEQLDRASGAGMFARAVDTFITLTRHEEDDCYTVEATTRSFSKPDPFVVRWQYPLWQISDELDPAKLRQPGRLGRAPQFTVEQITALLPAGGLKYGEWREAASESMGIKNTRFSELVGAALAAGLVSKPQFGLYVPQQGSAPK